MIGRWLIALAIGGSACSGLAAEVQVFGITVPSTGNWGVYARISDPSLTTPVGPVTQTPGLQSIAVTLLNNTSGSLSSSIVQGSTRTALPGGWTNVTDPDPNGLGTLGYGFWIARSSGNDVQPVYQDPTNPQTSPVIGVTVGDGQFSSWDGDPPTNPPPGYVDPNLVYKTKVLLGVALSAGAKPLGGEFVSDFNGSTTASTWTQPVLVARGKYLPPATSGIDSTLGLKFGAVGANVIRSLNTTPRVEQANIRTVDPRTLANPTPTATTLTLKGGPGDANLDGQVNFTDLVAVAQHYNQAGSWFDGDFNFDGIIDFADLVAVAQNYGQAVAGPTPNFSADFEAAFGSAVPEPHAAISVLTLSLLLTFRRTRR